jgi:hypothetical protein
MSVRRWVWCFLSIAVLAGGLGRVMAEPPAASGKQKIRDAKLELRVYQVADLVIPIGDPSNPPKDDGSKCAMRGAPCPKKGSEKESAPIVSCALVSTSMPATKEAELMKLIMDTVAPRSWVSHGGQGTMDYHPMTMSLCINQTPHVQDQIADLLAALRRLQDMEVAIEVRLLTISEEVYRNVDWGGQAVVTTEDKPATAFLSDKQVSRLLETAQADQRTNVMQAPKLTAFNGQIADVRCTNDETFVTGAEIISQDGQIVYKPKTEVIPLGLEMRLQPTISADRRFVQLHLKLKQAWLASAEVALAPISTQVQPVDVTNGLRAKPVVFRQFIQQPLVNKLVLERVLAIPEGGTAVLDGGQKVCGELVFGSAPSLSILSEISFFKRLLPNLSGRYEPHHALVLVTPRIITQPEEEEKKHSWGERGASETAESPEKPAPKYEPPLPGKKTALSYLLKSYEHFCMEGDLAAARAVAEQALAIDPTCFARPHSLGGKKTEAGNRP